MNKLLKQSTSKVVIFGPVVASDGVTPNTGLVSALDNGSTGIFLSKGGATPAIRHATVAASTYTSYGQYQITLDATDTATLGPLVIMWASTAIGPPVWDQWAVVPSSVYDAFLSTSLLTVNVGSVGSTSQTAGDLFAALTIASNRMGAVSGSGVNNLLGYFKAITRTDASDPTDLGGTYTAAHAALESFYDNALTAAVIADAVTAQVRLTKNLAFVNFPFTMYNTDGTLATTLLAANVTCQIQKDAGTVATVAATPVAKVDGSANKTGTFRVDLSQTEMNATTITFIATATGFRPTVINIITQE